MKSKTKISIRIQAICEMIFNKDCPLIMPDSYGDRCIYRDTETDSYRDLCTHPDSLTEIQELVLNIKKE